MWGLAPFSFIRMKFELITIPLGIVGVYLFFSGLAQQPKPTPPPTAKAICKPWVIGKACTTGEQVPHAYIQQNGKAVDLGPITPMPGIPYRRGSILLDVEKPRPILADAIRKFATRDVQVYCGMVGYGAADPWSGEIWLNSQFCNPLEQLRAGVYERPWRQGVGILTLAHEALHIRGILDEARTECVAYQNVDNLARMWRVSPWWQEVILREAYRDSQLLQRKSLYHSPKCREDGPWDQTPYDGRWP